MTSISIAQVVIAALAGIALFIYGLQAFARELRAMGGARLEAWLARATATAWQGYLVGAAVTAIVQSSSAVSAFVVAFVDGGIIAFRGALPVMLGANVGTASTAFLVSFKIGAFGSAFIVAGMAASMSPGRLQMAGRALFYFGVVIFALDLVSQHLGPMRDHPAFASLLRYAADPVLGILAGAAVTAIVQSSSITVGLTTVLVQQDMLSGAAILPLVIGANIGTTSTALLASLGMGSTARRAALANTLFNAAGAVVVLPFLYVWGELLEPLIGHPLAVPVAHLAFNIVVSAIGFLLLRPVEAWLQRI